MSTELANGAIIPSFFDLVDDSSLPQGEVMLRVGVIVAQYTPTDQGNLSKKWMEYDVQTYHLSNGTYSSIVYPRCYIGDMFGAQADYLEFTLRPSTLVNNSQSSQQNKLELGSNVLLLCVNGIRNQGIILSGIKNPNKPKEDPSLGHHLTWLFNGLQANVDKDGELTITFNGATNSDGTLASSANKNASGTFIKIDSSGNVTISDQTQDTSILWDRANKKITVNGDSEVDIESSGNVKIDSAGVLTGAATDNTMLGTTYRIHENAMNQILITQLTALANSMAITATSLTQAAAVLLANPVTAASAAGISAAAVSLGVSGSLYSAMASAIQTFESTAAQYLSKKNQSD